MNTTVAKDALMTILHANRSQHINTLNRALNGYRKHVRSLVERRLSQLDEGKTFAVIHFDVPQDHSKDYDTAIRMVDMHVDDTIELGEQEFNNYVMDNWEWRQRWIETTDSYT